jgi:hypothetical protein
MGNELRLLAVAQSGNNLRIGQKTIIIRSPVEKIMIIGPTEVTRDNTKADFTIRLLDKDGKYTIADWDRKIDLSATSGYFSQPQITIPRGQAEARVQYVSGASAGKAALKAESAGIAGGSMDITLATAPSWLVLAALVGGLVGGIVRQIHKDYKLERIMPRWNGECWELGLVGRIAGSVASGFFLYLTVKFGLLPMIGSPALPAALDLGTRTVALFFGGIGGFAGTVVFDRLVSWCLPAGKKEAAKAPAAPSAVS